MNTPVAEGPPVVLASRSAYRRELLGRILSAFECLAADVDETPLPDEAPDAMARRLARLKARAVAQERPDAIVIGSDQVPACDGEILRKPGDRDTAIRQLTQCSAQAVIFWTAVTVVDPAGHEESFVDETVVRFRALSPAEIERYVDAEQPYDCSGSFKVEGLGIALFEGVESHDPTGLQGLPLIRLAGCLKRCGIPLP